MKLVIYFSLIAFALVGSLFLTKRELRKNKKSFIATVKGLLVNIIILGFGSIWWFLTERDGVSQAIGVLIYLGAMILIALIVILFVYIGNDSKKS